METGRSPRLQGEATGPQQQDQGRARSRSQRRQTGSSAGEARPRPRLSPVQARRARTGSQQPRGARWRSSKVTCTGASSLRPGPLRRSRTCAATRRREACTSREQPRVTSPLVQRLQLGYEDRRLHNFVCEWPSPRRLGSGGSSVAQNRVYQQAASITLYRAQRMRLEVDWALSARRNVAK